jgi:hypothetical protein
MNKVIAVFVAVFVFAGSAEAQGLQRVGPWFINSAVDSMTDEAIGVAILQEDNAPRHEFSAIGITCSTKSSEFSIFWEAGDVISRRGDVAFRFDSDEAQEEVWNFMPANSLSPRNTDGFLDRLLRANRLVLRTRNYAGATKTATFTLSRTSEAIDRIKSICGIV